MNDQNSNGRRSGEPRDGDEFERLSPAEFARWRAALERATCGELPELGVDVDSSAEGPPEAEWREGWSVLSRALAEQDARGDRGPWAIGEWAAAVDREERAARRRVAWSLALSLSLVALFVGAFQWLDQRSQVAIDRMARDGESRRAAEVADAGGTPENSVDSSFEWDDELDERLEEAQESLVVLRAQWRGGDGSGEWLSERMESLRSEWEAESL
ncbi:MAG: hypothetical protein U0939_16315 [Pirellulales bacterium]